MCDALDLGYYYLGYYVDDCEKMKYKKKFGGEVLDIANLTYIPFEGMDNILQGGKFFTLRPTKNYDSKIEPLWCLTSKGFPFDYNPRLIRIENVAEDVYGDMERVESDAATALTQLCKKYDICTKSDIPLVLPGIIPIHQIIEMFAFEDVKNQYFNLIYVTSVERILKPFRYLSKKEKRIVLDTIRLFGLELTSRMFIML